MLEVITAVPQAMMQFGKKEKKKKAIPFTESQFIILDLLHDNQIIMCFSV